MKSLRTFVRTPSHYGRAAVLAAALVFANDLLAAKEAHALQPLTEFVARSKTWNAQNRAAHATRMQREAEKSQADYALAPTFTAQGTYTRNQYEVTAAALVPGGEGGALAGTIIQPQDQWDGYLTLNVPLINVGNWDKRSAASATIEAAKADEVNTDVTIAKSIVRDYYTLLGAEALLQSAQKNVEVADHNLKLARDRKDVGTGSDLDVQRSLADKAKADQSVTTASLSVTNTRRDLYSLSGLNAEPASSFPEDDLHEEAAVDSWLPHAVEIAAVKSADATRVAAEKTLKVGNDVWYPTLAATAQEHFTNATAFLGGHNEVASLQATAKWTFDASALPALKAQRAAAAAAAAREDVAKQQALDAVFRDWYQIHADIESARSARAQVTATALAASLAEDRYKSGVATQLDVLQARQDAFAADVARIQADADLAYARVALRIDAGQLDVVSAKETR